MAENKNNRKSNRNFRLEKPVERHFDIEKETGATPVMPDNNHVKQTSTHLQAKPVQESLQTNVTHSSGRNTGNSVPSKSPSGNDGGNERGGSSMKWVIIALIIMAIVACAYFFLTSSLRTPKFFVKEFSYFLMPCHQHCLGVNLLVQR